MSPDDTKTSAAEGVDLDEDLFNFDEISGGTSPVEDDDDADLDEIFATFQAGDEDEVIGRETPALADSGGGAAPAPATSSAPAPVAASVAASVAAPVAGAPAAGLPAGVPVQFMPGPTTVSVGMPRSMLWLFVAVTSVNAVLAIVTMNIVGSMSNNVQSMSANVASSVDEFANQAYNQLSDHDADLNPIAAPDLVNHEAFTTALAEIEAGEFADARRRLYALLAVVDRMDPVVRAKIEARANYLIAHAFQREATQRLGANR